MVKEQNLVLNPTKISGICGRLMCCMAYEHSTYNGLWRSLPSPGSKLKTPQGNYVLEGIDLRTETVRIRFPEGREVGVPIAEFADFNEAVLAGNVWKEEPAPEAARRVLPLPAGRLGTGLPESSREDSSRSAGRLRPEKISIEEHLAEREAERQQMSFEKAETEKAVLLKKRGKKRRSGSEGKSSAAASVHEPRLHEPRLHEPRLHEKEHPKDVKPRESAHSGDPRARPDAARPEASRGLRENRDRHHRRRLHPGEGGPRGKEGS
jgi:hypothetical protein